MSSITRYAREVRRSVYGRDARKPIADGLEQLYTGNATRGEERRISGIEKEVGHRPIKMEARLHTSPNLYKLVLVRADDQQEGT